MRGAHLVSIELLLAYFWGVILFIAPLLLAIYACFNYYSYLSIWFSHAWERPNFASIRDIFCADGTADTKCNIPLEVSNVTLYCINTYNATDCKQIRDDALDSAVDYGGRLIIGQSAIGFAELVFIVVSIIMSHKILTSPIITQSMNDVINWFLILPICGCLAEAIFLWWMTTLDFTYSWLVILLLSLAVAQVIALPLGIIAGRYKSRKLLAV